MFTLLSRPLGSIERLVIRHEPSFAELEILSGWGAGLNAWRIPNDNGTFIELLNGYSDEETFRKTQADTSAGVRLSPFPGRTRNAQWNLKGKSYLLENNVSWAPHALHGLLHTKPWRFVSFNSFESHAYLTLEYQYQGDHPGFPFPYLAKTSLSFSPNSFSVTSETTNTGIETMPYAEGWHPYFSLGKPLDDLYLQFPVGEKSITDEANIPTGRYETENRFVQAKKLDGISFNDSFLFNFENRCIETSLIDLEEYRKLTISQKAGKGNWKALQLYTAPDRKSIAIEPMTGEPDMLNHHRDLIKIFPGKTVSLFWEAKYVKISP